MGGQVGRGRSAMAADREGSRWEGWIVVGEEGEGEEVEVKREQRSVSLGFARRISVHRCGRAFFKRCTIGHANHACGDNRITHHPALFFLTPNL